MIASMKAEFRKLFTVRSTYGLLLFSLLLGVLLIGFWVFGYKDVDHAAQNPAALMDMFLQSASTIALFLSFAAILLVCHEYRYNTIMYNLTNTNRRTKLFAAKYLAVVLFGLITVAIFATCAWGAFYLGQHLQHVQTTAQNVPLWSLVWRAAITVIGDLSFAFIIAMLLRNLIGAIAVFLVLPTTVESLMALFLHDNTKYLPFTALSNLTDLTSKISYTFSLGVVAAYIVIGGFVAYMLFMRRDAN